MIQVAKGGFMLWKHRHICFCEKYSNFKVLTDRVCKLRKEPGRCASRCYTDHIDTSVKYWFSGVQEGLHKFL